MALIMLLGALLRLAQLDARALWFDEGLSLTFAGLPIRSFAYYNVLWLDVNPPAYRALLGLWTGLAGSSVLSARVLSAWLGIGAISLTYQIGRCLGLARITALTGALLAAVAPMQVYYSREAKGYTLIQVCILITIVVWLRLFPPLRHGSMNLKCAARRGSGLFAGTALALGSHYIAGLLVIVTGVWTVVWTAVSRRHNTAWQTVLPPAVLWFSIQAAASFVWLPWILATAQGAAEGTRTAAANIGLQPMPPAEYLFQIMREFGGGPEGWGAWHWIDAVGFPLFALAGLLFLARNRRARWLLASWWIGPVVLGLGVQMAMPFFYPRFLLYVTPAMALLAGQSTVTLVTSLVETQPRLIRGLRVLAPCLLLGSLTIQSIQVFSIPDPEIDLRPLSEVLAAQIEGGDALIYSYHWQPGMLAAYLPANLQPEMYPSFFEPDMLQPSMQSILDQHGRVWLLTYRISADDPINDVGRWLLSHAATPGEASYGESRLSLFIAPNQVDNAGAPTTCYTFDANRIELCFALFSRQRWDGSAPISVALHWTAQQPLVERYIVFVHLLTQGNPVPVAQQDSQPVNNLRPTYSWLPGETVLDLHAVNIPPEVQQGGGTLTVVVGLYDADTLMRVPVDGGTDMVEIGRVRLIPPEP